MSSPESAASDHDTDKVNALLAEVADGFGTANRHFAYWLTRDSGIREPAVPQVAGFVTRVVRCHISGGALDEALDVLSAQIRLLAEPMDAELLARGEL